MARLATPLTDKQVKNAKPKKSEYVLSDGNGLQLRVMPNGTKSWRWLYKSPSTKKQSRIALGTYPSLSIANARKLSRDYKEQLSQGIDPKEFKQKEHDEFLALTENTLYNVSLNWFEKKKTEVTTDYAQDIWRSLQLHVFPDLASQPISTLTAQQVIQVLKVVEAKGSSETVRRLCQRLNEIQTYAVNSGIADTNPLSGIKAAFYKPQKQHMKSLSPEELPELMNAISNASIKRTTRCLIEFQLHTMTRPNEAAGTRWDEIDFDNNIWIIPAERMKKRREHRIPLTKEVIGILKTMKQYSGKREYVFPADRNPSKPTNSQTANAALKRMGFAGRLVSHGLRSIASTTLNQEGHDPDIIEAALAHVGDNEVRRAYNRTDYLERRREMMKWWSTHIVNAKTESLTFSNNATQAK
ncbi:integrase domain-containing protein [Photobacterium ganghwense]|uniref:integrase domain-containing protein n=1 Tax=Photobacterium ganghwense TaxID=320778 RepID=UPI0040572661